MIIKSVKNADKYRTVVDYYTIHMPNHFVSSKDKEDPDWIKTTMDYYGALAWNQFQNNRSNFKGNYEMLNGIINKEDYYGRQDGINQYLDMQDWMEKHSIQMEEEDWIKHYPIINPPLNTLIGELTQRPDKQRVKAIDEYSFNEFIRAKTEMLNQMYKMRVEQIIQQRAAAQGIDLNIEPQSEEEAQQLQQQRELLTPKQIQKFEANFQSTAEKWGNLKLKQLRLAFNIQEKSEEAYEDLLVAGREWHHVRPNKSKLGLSYEVENPMHVWYLAEPHVKFTDSKVYAIGTIKARELSSIIEEYDLTQEEIEYLRDRKDLPVGNPRADGNVWESKTTGIQSINYSVHDPALTEWEAMQRTSVDSDTWSEQSMYAEWPNGYLTTRYTVIHAYFISKRKVGLYTYRDEEGEEISEIVDDYIEIDKKDPSFISIDWKWINEVRQIVKIGQHVYVESKPVLWSGGLMPIQGGVWRNKNTRSRSMVDLMKPYQIIYNIAANQLYLLLEKEIGNVPLINLRQIPKHKDVGDENAFERFVDLAKSLGFVGIDDSPENMGGPSQFNQNTILKATRGEEMQSRIQIMAWAQMECWKLVGITEQRLGGVQASESATGTQAALTQSFSQTEPYTTFHENVMSRVYQLLIDTAQFVESKKPMSTITYVNDDLQNIFFQMNSEELRLPDLGVFVTRSSKESKILEGIRMQTLNYAQQNLHPYYSVLIHNSESVAEIKEFLEQDMIKQEERANQEMQMKQQELQQQQEMEEAQRNEERMRFEAEQDLEWRKIQLENQTKLLIAELNNDEPTGATSLDADVLYKDYEKMMADKEVKSREISRKEKKDIMDTKLKQQELALKNKEIESRERIAERQAQVALKNKVSGEK